MSYSNKNHSSRDSGSSFLPPLSPWKNQEDSDTFSTRPQSRKKNTRVLSSSVKDEPLIRPKSSKTSPRQAKANVKLPKIDHKTNEGQSNAFEEPEQESQDKKDEIIPRKNPEEFSNIPVLPSINGETENKKNYESDDNVFEEKIDDIIEGRQSNNSSRQIERTGSQRLSRPKSGKKTENNPSRSSNRSPFVSRPGSSRKASVLDNLEISKNNSRASSPILNINLRPNSGHHIDSENKAKSRLNSPLLDIVRNSSRNESPDSQRSKSPILNSSAKSHSREQSPILDNIVRAASRNGTYILEDEEKNVRCSSRNGTFVLDHEKKRSDSRESRKSHTARSAMDDDSQFPLLERNSPKSRHSSGRKSKLLENHNRPKSGQSTTSSVIDIDSDKMQPLLDQLDRTQSRSNSPIFNHSSRPASCRNSSEIDINFENGAIRDRLDSDRKTPVLENIRSNSCNRISLEESITRPESGGKTPIKENITRSSASSRSRRQNIQNTSRPNSGSQTPITDNINRFESNNTPSINDNISRPDSGNRTPLLDKIDRHDSSSRTPIAEDISRPNSGNRSRILDNIDTRNTHSRTSIKESIDRPDLGNKTPIKENISRPDSGNRTPIQENINWAELDNRTPIKENISRPGSDNRTSIVENIGRLDSGNIKPILDSIDRNDSHSRTPITENLSRPDSGINRQEFGNKTPIKENISRSNSFNKTPIKETISRPYSGNRTPILSNQDRHNSRSRTPIAENISRPNSGNRTPIKENISRPHSGGKTTITENVSRQNSYIKTEMKENINRNASADSIPKDDNSLSRPNSGKLILSGSRPDSGKLTLNKSRPNSRKESPIMTGSHSRSQSPNNVEISASISEVKVSVSASLEQNTDVNIVKENQPEPVVYGSDEIAKQTAGIRQKSVSEDERKFSLIKEERTMLSDDVRSSLEFQSESGIGTMNDTFISQNDLGNSEQQNHTNLHDSMNSIEMNPIEYTTVNESYTSVEKESPVPFGVTSDDVENQREDSVLSKSPSPTEYTLDQDEEENCVHLHTSVVNVAERYTVEVYRSVTSSKPRKRRRTAKVKSYNESNVTSAGKPCTTSSASEESLAPAIHYSLGTTIVAITEPGVYFHNRQESRQSNPTPVKQVNEQKEVTSKESLAYQNIQAYTLQKDENDNTEENQIVSRETLTCEHIKAKCIDDEGAEPVVSSYTSADSDTEESSREKHNDDENNVIPVFSTTCVEDEEEHETFNDDIMATERLVFEEIVLKRITQEEAKQNAQGNDKLVYSREAKIYNIENGYIIDQWATEDFIDVVAKQMADIAITRVLNEDNFLYAPEPEMTATRSNENKLGSSQTNNDCSERNNSEIRPHSVSEDKNQLQRTNMDEEERIVNSSETLRFVNSVAKTLMPGEEGETDDRSIIYSQESLMYTVDQAHPIEEWAIEDDIDVVAKTLVDIAITRVLNEGNEEEESGPIIQGYALENDTENTNEERRKFDEQSQRTKEREFTDKDKQDEDHQHVSTEDFVSEASESLKFENIMAYRVTGDEEFDKSIVYSQEIQCTTIDRGYTDEVLATEDLSEIMIRQLVDTALITALNDEEDDQIEPPLFDETANTVVNKKQNMSRQKQIFDESERTHDEIADDNLIQTSSETLKYEEIILQTLTPEESSKPADKGLVYSREVKKYIVDQSDIIEQWATEDFIDVVAKTLADIAITRVLNENNDADMVPVEQTCLSESQDKSKTYCSTDESDRNAMRSSSRSRSIVQEEKDIGQASEKLVYEHIRATGVDDTDKTEFKRTTPVPVTTSSADNNDKYRRDDDIITASENKRYEHIIVDSEHKPVVTEESIVQSREINEPVVTDKSLVQDLFATEDFIDVMAKILADIALLRAINSLDDKEEEIQPTGFEDSPAARRNSEKKTNEKHDDTRAKNQASDVRQYAVSHVDETDYEYGIPIKCNQFYLEEDVAFLNHGSFGAVPKDVVAELEGVIKEHETNPDEWERVKWQGYQDESLQCVAEFIGADKRDVAFVESTIRGIKRIFAASDIENDDEIVINNWTVKGVRKVVNTVCKIFTSVHCTTIVHDIPIKDPEQILDQYRILLKNHKKVKMVIVDHISSAPSVLFPIKELVEICRANGVMIVINGAHGPGHVPINVKELNADFYVGNLSKWAYAPTGCAFIWTHPSHRAQMVEIRHMFKNDREISKNQFYTAKHALDFYYKIGGMERITAYNNHLLDNATDMLATSWGTTVMWVPKSMEAPFMRCVMLPHITYVPRTPAGAHQIFKFLWDKYQIWAPVFCIGRRLYVRISAQVYCIPEDYVRLKDAVLEMVEMAEEQMAEVYVVNNQLPKKDSDLWSMMSVSLTA